MGRIGGGELLLILVIALLIFGPSKLADMGKGLGEGLKNFKKGISQEGADDEPKPASPPTAAPEPPKVLTAGAPTVVESVATAAHDESAQAATNTPK